MTIEELKRKAVWQGHSRITVSHPYHSNGTYKATFHEITHFFNADLDEIGLVAQWNKEPLIFNPPRKWAEEYLTAENLALTEVFC